MITVWIGDFRIKQLQKMTKALQQTVKYYFLTDDTADYVWLKDSAIKQFSRLYLENANVIIALGFIDCVYSCVSQNFKIDTAINQYNTIINSFKTSYPGCKLYFCSVNPINGDYYFAGNKITQSTLTNKIKYFNNKIKENNKITFIDSYEYLTDANFVTRDGISFTSASCAALLNYIKTITGYEATLSKEGLCTANSYNISINDMKPNARYIYQYLTNKGWSLNAIAGILGNIQVESKMSPCMWQGTIDGSIINDDETHTLNTAVLGDREPGYGLVQWTPYTKYTEWCTTEGLDYWDIDSQLQRICWEVENNTQWQKRESKGYDLSFSEFTTSAKDAYWLAGAFAFCYERPGSSTGTEEEQNNLKIERGDNANYWYEYLSNFNFEPADEPEVFSDIPQPELKIEKVFTGTLAKTVSLYLK